MPPADTRPCRSAAGAASKPRRSPASSARRPEWRVVSQNGTSRAASCTRLSKPKRPAYAARATTTMMTASASASTVCRRAELVADAIDQVVIEARLSSLNARRPVSSLNRFPPGTCAGSPDPAREHPPELTKQRLSQHSVVQQVETPESVVCRWRLCRSVGPVDGGRASARVSASTQLGRGPPMGVRPCSTRGRCRPKCGASRSRPACPGWTCVTRSLVSRTSCPGSRMPKHPAEGTL